MIVADMLTELIAVVALALASALMLQWVTLSNRVLILESRRVRELELQVAELKNYIRLQSDHANPADPSTP